MTYTIDAHEERDNAIVDVGHAFLHADNDEHVLMKLRGKIVELLVELEPTMYRKYVTTGPNLSCTRQRLRCLPNCRHIKCLRHVATCLRRVARHVATC